VSSVVQGYNGTILCYGQTGAGKTFTMTGSSTEYKYRGIVPRAVAQVYHEIADRFDQAITIRISYVEIYNEMVSINEGG
jgi:kinesin family member 6/9